MASFTNCERCGKDTDYAGACNLMLSGRRDRRSFLFCVACAMEVEARIDRMCLKQKKRAAKKTENARAKAATKVKVEEVSREEVSREDSSRALLLLPVNPPHRTP